MSIKHYKNNEKAISDVNASLDKSLTQINDLETNKAEKSVVALKADISYVDTKTQGVSLAYKESYATLVALQTAYPTGNIYNHAVLADGFIYTYANSAWTSTGIQANGTGIADKAVTPIKLSDYVLTGGKNKFDKSKALTGKTIVGSTGVINDNQYYFITDYIPVSPLNTYKISGNNPANPVNYSFYDVNKTFISGTQPAGFNPSFTPPANAAYVISNGRIENIDTFQIELGTISTTYESYIGYYKLANQKVSDIDVLANMALTDFDLINKIINSDFANGTTGFSVGGGVGAVASNVLTITGNGSNAIVFVGDTQAGVVQIGHRYFGMVKARVTNSNCLKLRLIVAGNGVFDVLNPVINQWYSLFVEYTATGNRNDSISVQSIYADTTTANGKAVEIKELMLIDLSTRFGTGSEPIEEEVIELLSKYPSSWFNGTAKNLLNLKELYILQANKLRNIISSGGYSKWKGKTFVTFGDSITWYDGNAYNVNNKESGIIAKGYQSYMREKFLCTVVNKGFSGYDMTQIYWELKNYDFTGVNAVTITSGANDHRKGILPGTVLPIGSVFTLTEFAGALQKSIETIISFNNNIKIYLLTPIRGWFSENLTTNVPNAYKGEMTISEDYANVIKSIGALYGLPVCDLYNLIGLNTLNKDTILGDNPAVFPAYQLHLSTVGYEREQNVIVPFLNNN